MNPEQRQALLVLLPAHEDATRAAIYGYHNNGADDPGARAAQAMVAAFPALLAALEAAEALSFKNGFEVARLAPSEARARSAKRLADVWHSRLLGLRDWAEESIEVNPSPTDRWDLGWNAALRAFLLSTWSASVVGGEFPYLVDPGCLCKGRCPLCARYGCETCCDGEMPSDHGARDADERAAGHDDLRRHLVSAHYNGAALGLSDYAALVEHHHEHAGPGTIRNHDANSRHWDQTDIARVLAETREMGGE